MFTSPMIDKRTIRQRIRKSVFPVSWVGRVWMVWK